MMADCRVAGTTGLPSLRAGTVFHLIPPEVGVPAELAAVAAMALACARGAMPRRALAVGVGVALGTLGRGADEIKVYEQVIARFGAAAEWPLREQVAKALVALGTLGQRGGAGSP